MRRSIKKIIGSSLDLLLTKERQIYLSQVVFNRAQGQGSANPETNGEYRLLRTIKNGLRGRSAIIFDVGANVGEWTDQAAWGMSASLSIYSFEPSRSTFLKLKNTLFQANHAAKIEPINRALGNTDGNATLFVAGEYAGSNSLYLRHAEAWGVQQKNIEEVVVGKGDLFCKELGIDHIDFLKIDTEGHEMAVLLGFETMLSRRDIDFIQFEYGGTWIDSRMFLMDAFEFLLPKGYLIGKIYPDGVEFFNGYDQRQEMFVYANYLAVRPEFSEKLKKFDSK